MTTKLRDARLRRGWSQARLISEIQTAADRRGAALPDASVLKTQISRWENGHRVPAEFNQSIKTWPAGAQERDRGLALARLATAYAGAHEVEDAVTTGHAALKVLKATGSARILTQIHDLRRELAPVWETPTVRDFNRAFTATTAWKA